MIVDQDTRKARRGTQCTRPASPHTFILDGHWLRQLRVKRGLLQQGLADQAAISLTIVASVERQRRAPCRGWTLGRLARAPRRAPCDHDTPAAQRLAPAIANTGVSARAPDRHFPARR